MSKLIDYFDPERATINALRDFRDQYWKLEHDPVRIQEMDANITTPRGMSSTPVHGGGSHFEETLCAVIDKKAVLREGHRRAMDYDREFAPCWMQLTDEERDLLTLRFVDRSEGSGISIIMRKYNWEKTKAYQRSNEALQRLSKLLFW